MEIIIQKRTGENVAFDKNKVEQALHKAYKGINKSPDLDIIATISEKIHEFAKSKSQSNLLITVEEIQDMVEKFLMLNGEHDIAKSYILYRDKHSEMRKIIKNFKNLGYECDVINELRNIQSSYPSDYNLIQLYHKVKSFITPNMNHKKLLDILIRSSLELTSIESPKWEFISSIFLSIKIHKQVRQQNEKYNINSFYDKLKIYTEMGLYNERLLECYLKEEIDEISQIIDNSKDKLFNYSGLNLLYKRYLLRTFDNIVVETPQEMFLGIALQLALPEKDNKINFIKDLYDILSNLKVTMATPTISNARKPHHQLSSCFIDVVDDSLNGIYKSIDNFAKISKAGGGMGLYFGKVRASGSDIRGFKGVSGGVIRWIKLANDTAVAVDQLGVRQGSVAVYLDIWHKDIPEFLQLKTNNGDDRTKAHDVFPGICYPDLFWKMVKTDLNSTWYMMCPHEIKLVKGYSLEDYYGTEWEKRYFECVEDPRIPKREIIIKDLIRLILKSCVETGTPFTFNRDTVNRANPNKHAGIIYSSNLCMEILQNMSPIEQYDSTVMEILGKTYVVDRSTCGDFVVCNLASLVLGHIDINDEEELKRIIYTTVRALDNVIDSTLYPVPYAEITNKRYRAIGLGVSGYHHMLVNHGISWESEEHLKLADIVFEKISYYAIEASMLLAKEKGSYQLFTGSDWDNGNYFKLKNYTSGKWKELAKNVHKYGIRNSYLLAIAPTSSTSIISTTTSGIDPIMHKYFLEEKKGDILPRVAPNLNEDTFWLYKSAHTIDQSWSLKAAGVRQRHIDQGQSLNIYITTEYSMREILDLFIEAWERGVKTLYYVRSKSLDVEECESCSN